MDICAKSMRDYNLYVNICNDIGAYFRPQNYVKLSTLGSKSEIKMSY